MEEIKNEYLASLDDLTFNSKPLINSLTMIAGENIPAAVVIVQAIQERFQKAPPKQKLPFLYLIDSILKNIGNDYIQLFSQNIVSLFFNAFQAVDPKTQQNFLRVRATWNSIFPAKKLEALDGKLGILSEPLEAKKNVAFETSQFSPHSTSSTSHQFNQQFSAISSDPRKLIEEQNKLIFEAEEILKRGTLNPRREEMLREQISQLKEIRQEALAQLSWPNSNPSCNPFEVSDLVHQLVVSGVIPTREETPHPSFDGMDSSARNQSYSSSSPSTFLSPSISPINFSRIFFDGSSQISHHPRNESFIESLYSNLPLKCVNCGLRFSTQSKSQFADHLDWHFRKNRREKEKFKKSISRNWYPSDLDWIQDSDFFPLEKEKPANSSSFFDSIQAEKIQDSASHPSDPASSPPTCRLQDSDPTSAQCHVCLEKLVKFWNDKNEEWNYRDTIRVGSFLYHQQCFQDSSAHLEDSPTSSQNLSSNHLTNQDFTTEDPFNFASDSKISSTSSPKKLGRRRSSADSVKN